MNERQGKSIEAQIEHFYNMYKKNVEYTIKGYKTIDFLHVEDLVEEVFLRALCSLRSREETIEYPKSWLIKIAKNVCNQFLRDTRKTDAHPTISFSAYRSSEEREDMLLNRVADEETSIESKAELHELVQELYRGLDELPKEERVAVLIRHVYAYNAQEMAASTNRAPSTIRRDANRGIERLRTRLRHMQE